MSIKCCHHCVPPKRHTNCWSTCPEYQKEKKEWDEYREQEHIKSEIHHAIYERRADIYMKYIKRHRNRKLK